MKKILFAALAGIWIMACNTVDKEKTGNPSGMQRIDEDNSSLTTIQWLDSAKNYGTISEGQRLDVSFRFKNTGEKPLVISGVRPSCGCTVADPPKEPVAPGGTGTINASFNSEGREGMNKKEIFVSANTKGMRDHVLTFEVEVVKK